MKQITLHNNKGSVLVDDEDETSRKKWKAVLMVEGTSHFIGRFETEDEAQKAYNNFRERVFKT